MLRSRWSRLSAVVLSIGLAATACSSTSSSDAAQANATRSGQVLYELGYRLADKGTLSRDLSDQPLPYWKFHYTPPFHCPAPPSNEPCQTLATQHAATDVYVNQRGNQGVIQLEDSYLRCSVPPAWQQLDLMSQAKRLFALRQLYVTVVPLMGLADKTRKDAFTVRDAQNQAWRCRRLQ